MTRMQEARPPGQGSGLADRRAGGRVVTSHSTTARALARLRPHERLRVLDRLAELRSLDRTMRERGTLAEAS